MNTKTIECTPSFTLDDSILSSREPIVLRGLVKNWPLVEAAQQSDTAVSKYLTNLYNGRPLTVVRGEAENEGRVAYNDDLSKLNCASFRASLPEALDLMLGEADRLHYIGTTATESIMPDFRQHNDVLTGPGANQYIWLGSRSCIPAHFDVPDNIACNVVGRRRFTLFPPDQLENLYVGPLDFTPAGQAISMVDVRKPDYKRFPKYRAAEQVAQVVVLEPGDALFLPSMWWHNVEGLDDLNVLINYWWRRSPGYMSSPADVLELALLSIRDLPAEQKMAWKNIIDYYVFNDNKETFAHIPKSAQGSVGKMDDTIARKIVAKVLSRLNR